MPLSHGDGPLRYGDTFDIDDVVSTLVYVQHYHWREYVTLRLLLCLFYATSSVIGSWLPVGIRGIIVW